MVWKCDRHASRTDFHSKEDINHLLIWRLSTLIGWISPFWITAICICLMNSYAQHVILHNHMRQGATAKLLLKNLLFSSHTTNKCKNMASNLNAFCVRVFNKTPKIYHMAKSMGTWPYVPFPKPWTLTLSFFYNIHAPNTPNNTSIMVTYCSEPHYWPYSVPRPLPSSY